MPDFISPPQHYQINGEVTPLRSQTTPFATGTNQVAVTAITGKIILLMGWYAYSAGGGFNLKDAAAGAGIFFGPGVLNGIDLLPVIESGYGVKTTAGNALGIDVATAAVNLTIFYIAYTP